MLAHGDACQAIYSPILTASALRWKKTRLAAAPYTVIIIVGGDQQPTTSSVFFYGIMLSGSFTSLPATQQADASFNRVMTLLTADFFGYLRASFRDCMHSLLWRAHKTLEAVYSISQLPTGFFAMDCLDVWV